MKKNKQRSSYLGWLSAALAADGPQPARGERGNLVLGYATGYDAGLIAPFVRSLRAVYAGPWLWWSTTGPTWSLC